MPIPQLLIPSLHQVLWECSTLEVEFLHFLVVLVTQTLILVAQMVSLLGGTGILQLLMDNKMLA